MLQLQEAFKMVRNDHALNVYWYEQVKEFIKQQQYSLRDYEEFCIDVQEHFAPVVTIPKQRFIADLIARKVPFTKENIYYALCIVPNYSKRLSNALFPCPTHYDSFLYKDMNSYEIPGVTFFKDMQEVHNYYLDILEIQQIVFHAMALFWHVTDDINDEGISKYKIMAQHNRNRFANKLLSLSFSTNVVTFFNVTVNNNIILLDLSLPKIFKDCLEAFKRSHKTLGRLF